MNGMDVYNSITKLDESVIDSSLTKKKYRFGKALIIKTAVCAVLIAAAFITYAVIKKNGGGKTAFSLTAYAENGESMALYTNGWPNNVPAEYHINIFGNNDPCFNFLIWPEDSGGRTRTEYFNISVRYEYLGEAVSITAETKDDHLRLGFLVKKNYDSHFSGYAIMGQFSEPATVYVYITEKETGESVENYRIQVEYSAERGEYELTVDSIDPPGRLR